MEKLPVEVAVAQPNCQTIGLITMDLDNFKQRNQTRGYDGRDQVLCHFSIRVPHKERPQDPLCRMDGEESHLVLPDTNLKGT